MRPDLYAANRDGTAGPALKIGSGAVHEDVPRTPNPDGSYSALLGDPRNDENLSSSVLFTLPLLTPLAAADLAESGLAPRSRRANFLYYAGVVTPGTYR